MTRSAKIMLLGDIGVGKTSLAKRFVFDRFDSDYKTTIGVNILTHDIVLPADCDGAAMRLVLWDTDGDFGQTLFRTSYVLGAAGAIVVADATRESTIHQMAKLADAFEERFPGRPVSCVINKVDLPNAAAPRPEGARPALLTSALTGAGVAEMFVATGAAVWRRGL